MSEPLRIGVLGTGSIAQVVHLPLLGAMADARVEAVCDVDRSKATAIANRFGIPRVHRTDDAVFADDTIDAVIICSPSHLHEEQAVAALHAGKHVLVEKPLALTAEGAERVLTEAEAAGRTVMVAMNNRLRPDVALIKPFAQGGELGDLFLVRAGWLNRKVRVARPTWRHRLETAGGGALMDLGVQMLDLCLWLLDYPPARRVVAHTHPGEGMEVEDTASVLVQLEGGAVVSMDVSWSLLGQRDRHHLQILGMRGSATLSPLAVYKEVEHGLLDVTPQVATGSGNAYTASYEGQLRMFIEAARGERAVEPPVEQVELMRIIALAYESAREGRELGG